MDVRSTKIESNIFQCSQYLYTNCDKACFPSDDVNGKWTNSVALRGHLISLGTLRTIVPNGWNIILDRGR